MWTLAEIADKMPSLLWVLFGSCIFAALAIAVARRRWWLGLIAVPMVVRANYGFAAEMLEVPFRSQLIAELGTRYVVGRHVAATTPFIAAGVGTAMIRRSQIRGRRTAAGVCIGCGYTRAGPTPAAVCPECGATAG